MICYKQERKEELNNDDDGGTSGAYIQATVKVPRVHIRAPNNNPVVNKLAELKLKLNAIGKRKTLAMKNMIIIDTFRPILSTMMADKTIPGTSAKLVMNTSTYRLEEEPSPPLPLSLSELEIETEW